MVGIGKVVSIEVDLRLLIHDLNDGLGYLMSIDGLSRVLVQIVIILNQIKLLVQVLLFQLEKLREDGHPVDQLGQLLHLYHAFILVDEMGTCL